MSNNIFGDPTIVLFSSITHFGVCYILRFVMYTFLEYTLLSFTLSFITHNFVSSFPLRRLHKNLIPIIMPSQPNDFIITPLYTESFAHNIVTATSTHIYSLNDPCPNRKSPMSDSCYLLICFVR